MTYKVTTFIYVVVDKKQNLKRRVYSPVKTGLTWQEAKDFRGRGMFIVPEVIRNELSEGE